MLVADKEEKLRVYNANNEYPGRKEFRSIVHKNHLFHREVALWIIDLKNNAVLLQKRSKNKLMGANKLGILAGHVVGDDSLISTVKKEVGEELGVNLGEVEIHKLYDFQKRKKNNFCHIYHYYILTYIPIKEIDIQEEEVSRVMYFDYDFLKKCIKEGNEQFVIPWDKNHREIFKRLDKIFKHAKK